MDFPERLKSRKLWAALITCVAGLAVMYLNDGRITPNEFRTAIEPVVMVYLAAQGVVDTARVFKK